MELPKPKNNHGYRIGELVSFMTADEISEFIAWVRIPGNQKAMKYFYPWDVKAFLSNSRQNRPGPQWD